MDRIGYPIDHWVVAGTIVDESPLHLAGNSKAYFVFLISNRNHSKLSRFLFRTFWKYLRAVGGVVKETLF